MTTGNHGNRDPGSCGRARLWPAFARQPVLWLVVGALFLGGCASKRPAGLSCPTITAEMTMERAFDMSGAPAADRGAHQTRYVLALSGGGAWGAFGAGFLQGWAERGAGAQPARPAAFDIVTGTSTGALQSTYAFLGSSYDKALVDQYADRTDRDIFKQRSLLSLLSANSLATTGPLQASIRAMITPEVIQAVAREGAAGRRLIVGAVNLDKGNFQPIDLTKLAQGYASAPEQTRDCYVGALLASASTPLSFPPVFINGDMFTDGGVRQTVFVSGLQAALMQGRGAQAPHYDITVIMNTDLRIDPPLAPGAVVPNSIPGITQRLLPIVVDQTDHDALNLIVASADLEPNISARWTSAQHNNCLDLYFADKKNREFKPAWMNCLIDYGRTDIWDASPWHYEPTRSPDQEPLPL